ncbi:MAG: pilus assembly protein PilP [Pseudomonadota bacterium]
MTTKLKALALATLAVVALTGCQRNTSDLERWVATTLQTPAGDIEPIPPIATTEIVTYEGYELRDPFQQRTSTPEEEIGLFTSADDNGIRPDPNRRREFLEGFPLDTLDMVGTLNLEGIEFALIRDNDSVVHRVSEGNYMGMNHGRVIRVRPDRVELVELYEDGRGVWSERRSQVAMEDS